VAFFSRPRDARVAEAVRERLRAAFVMGPTAPAPRPLILEVIR
jgi:hypothetical protein